MVARGLLAVEASTPKMGAWTAELNYAEKRGADQGLKAGTQPLVRKLT